VAGALACATLLLIGWSGLLIPSLIRSVKTDFVQTDAGMGLFYFVYAVAYALASLGGGLLTERLGRRTVLTGAALLHGVGLLTLGTATSWEVFLAGAIPAGLGAGALDGGVNGLVLDLYRDARGRALNLLHLFFSLGALSAPLAVGRLVEAGVPWPSILVATAVGALIVAGLFAVVRMPSGRRSSADPSAHRETAPAGSWLAGPLILLAVAIACYVAAEIGVSSWLVRYLEPAPLSTATTALALFWGGLTLGRLVAARVADRFDHVRFTTLAALATAITLLGAILVPWVPVSIALFALTGFVTGPIFPMIIAIGGERYPDRSAAVSGMLGSAAVVGSVIYPPVMGFLSVTVGLTAAMLGNVILALACAGTLAIVGSRSRVPDARLSA
jgi:fucose permease